MPSDEQYINAIDQLIDIQRNAESQTARFIEAIGKLVVTVAAHEATYEIEAASSIAEPASLAESTEAISTTRSTLTDTIEEAIKVSKYGFHAKYEEKVLRNQLLSDFPTDSTD